MADEKMNPISEVKPPVADPLAASVPLKPVVPHKPVAQNTVSAGEQLKGMTQRLNGITQQIPQQAILHKTGIIADSEQTEAQKQAAKSRTARISLSDAMGIAPVKEEAAPMKTIRIKRPVAAAPAAAPAVAPQPVAEAATPETSVTQRKTLKINRPGAPVRPASKLTVKRPEAEAPADEVADIPEVTDEVKPLSTKEMFASAANAPKGEADVSTGVAVMGLVIQIAACAVMGFLGYLLYNDVQNILF